MGKEKKIIKSIIAEAVIWMGLSVLTGFLLFSYLKKSAMDEWTVLINNRAESLSALVRAELNMIDEVTDICRELFRIDDNCEISLEFTGDDDFEGITALTEQHRGEDNFVNISRPASVNLHINAGQLYSGILNARRLNDDAYDFVLEDIGRDGKFDPDTDICATNYKRSREDEPVDISGLELKESCFSSFYVDGEQFYGAIRHVDEDIYAVHASRMTSMISRVKPVTFILLLPSLLLAVLIRLYIGEYTIDHRRREKTVTGSFSCQSLNSVLRKAGVAILTLCLLFALMLLFHVFSNTVESGCRNNSYAAGLVETDRLHAESRNNIMQDLYSRLAQNESQLMNSMYPILMNMSETELEKISRTLDAEFIMLFDRNGRLVVTDSGYGHMGLKDIAEDGALLPLLQGIEPVKTVFAIKDPLLAAGSEIELMGYSICDEKGRPDGAVVIACQKSTLESYERTEDETNLIAGSLTTSDTEVFVIDSDTREVTFSTLNFLKGQNMSALNITEDMLSHRYSGVLSLNGKSYMAESAVLEDRSVFLISKGRTDFRFALIVTLITGILFAGGILISVLEPFLGYPDWNVSEDINNYAVPITHGIDKYLFGDIISRAHGRSVGEDLFQIKDINIRKTSFLFKAMLVYFVYLILVMYFGIMAQPEALFLSGNRVSSFNVISVAQCVVTIVIIAFISGIIRFILRILADILSQRMTTLCRLLRSCTSYAAVIIGLFLCMHIIGVDTKRVWEAMGIAGIIVGLGARSLIEDLIAGLFTIFEGIIKVGDVVLLDGNYGVVKEIGLRTTQIVNKSNEIIAVTNSKIKVMVNTSRFSSAAYITFTIPHSQDIDYVVAVFKKEMSILSEKKEDSRIIWGPIFHGVRSISEKGIEVAFLAGCDESYVASVKRSMNVILKQILDRYEIPCTSFYLEQEDNQYGIYGKKAHHPEDLRDNELFADLFKDNPVNGKF